MSTRKLTWLAAALLTAGCGTTQNHDAEMMRRYHEELARTTALPSLSAGTAKEAEATQNFIDFFKVYTADAIHRGIRNVYASDAYFADPFTGHRGIDEIEKYFVDSTEPIQDCVFEVQQPAVRDGNYYFRWIMRLHIKRNPKELIEALGMSHVRFDPEGKVIFQQDYWDTGLLMAKIPVLGWGVRKVRSHIQ